MTPENRTGNIANFCGAIGNVSREMIAAGVAPSALAAGLRIEAAKVEKAADAAPMSIDDGEMLDVLKRAHEFINTLQVAGIDERVAVVSIGNALIERVARSKGATGAARWLEGLARNVAANADAINATTGHH